jgi:hypothetical protein
MRIRWGVGLPGPFVLTGDRSRHHGGAGVALLVVLAASLLGFCFEYPVLGIVVTAVVAVLVAAFAWAVFHPPAKR